MAKEPTFKTTRKASKRVPKALDTVLLTELAEQIDAVKHSRPHLCDLMARFAIENGLTLKSGITNTASMAGVRASSTESAEMAVMNWANAARRAVLQAA